MGEVVLDFQDSGAFGRDRLFASVPDARDAVHIRYGIKPAYRVIMVADTFDAMTTNRPYQKAMELGYVVEKIKSFAGTRFDPRVVEAFVQAVKRGDIQIDEQVRGAA